MNQILSQQNSSEPKTTAMGMVVVKNSAQMEAEQAQQEQQSKPIVEPLSGLSAYVNEVWQAAIQAKTDIEQELLLDLAQRKGEYTAEQQAQLSSQGEPTVYDNITEVKAAAAEAWIKNIIVFQPNDHPWGLSPTPIADLPPDQVEAIAQKVMIDFMQAQNQGQFPQNIQSLPVQQQQAIASQIAQYAGRMRKQMEDDIQQEARDRAARMERRISDQLEEGGFEEAFRLFLKDLTTYKTAFLKGPCVRRMKEVTYARDQAGRTYAVTSWKIGYQYEHVSPFDIYPVKNATHPRDGILERRRFSRNNLEAMLDTEGVNNDELRMALQDQINAGYQTFQSIDSQRARLEDNHNSYMSRDDIEGLEFCLPIRGQLLNEFYKTERFTPHLDYSIIGTVVKNRVIKAIENADPMSESPYYAASFRSTNGTIWGRSIPDLAKDKQRAINTAFRSLCRNMPMSSGPQTWFDPSAVPKGFNFQGIAPWGVYQLVKKADGSTGKPIEFTNIPFVALQYMEVRERLVRQCDEDTGIPPYVYGLDKAAGAGKTMGGLSMLMNAASMGIKDVISDIDSKIFKPLIKRQWTMNMLYDEDESIKGDVHIVARGAMALFTKEQTALRRMEMIGQTNNPVDMSIFGITGRAAMWREVFKAINIDPAGILPTEDELKTRLEAMAAQEQQQKALDAQNGRPIPQEQMNTEIPANTQEQMA